MIVRQVGDPIALNNILTKWSREADFTAKDPLDVFRAAAQENWDKKIFSQVKFIQYRQGWLTLGLSNQPLLSELAQFRQQELADGLRAGLTSRGVKKTLRGLRFVPFGKQRT